MRALKGGIIVSDNQHVEKWKPRLQWRLSLARRSDWLGK